MISFLLTLFLSLCVSIKECLRLENASGTGIVICDRVTNLPQSNRDYWDENTARQMTGG